MGRPKVPESEKMRSFPIRLAPRSLGRQLTLLSRITSKPQQDILRSLVEDGLEKMYAKALAQGADLPPILRISSLTDDEFRKMLSGPEPAPRPKLVKRPSNVDA